MSEQMIADTRAAAANIEHEWDRKALDWPLNGDSVVVEVGGYVGRWALQIAERYHPRLFVFEPQPWAAAVCQALLKDSATVVNAALGDQDRIATMEKWETDGCTLVQTVITTNQVRIHEISAAFKLLDITTIDLMLMNIEGYEYTLLPHMLDQGILPARLMVQFHDHADLDGSKRATIAQRLAGMGYTVAWEYWALTAWERR